MNKKFSANSSFANKIVNLVYRFPKGSVRQSIFICLPFTILGAAIAFMESELSIGMRLVWFLSGVLVWTVLEYVLHRFVLHYEPTGPISEAFLNRLHIDHHDTPKDPTIVCMPIIFLGPIWFLIMGIIWLFGGGDTATPLFVFGLGTLTVLYDITHWATHQLGLKNRIFKYLKAHHMQHHYVDADKKFGVTSPLWDWVFKTL